MGHRIRLSPSGEQFDCPADTSILAAAIAANILISYGCRSGLCGSCLGRIMQGSIEYPNGRPDAISETEAAGGLALFCSAHALSDLTIELSSAETIFD